MRNIENKGLGLISTKKFEKEEIFLRESPIISILSPKTLSQKKACLNCFQFLEDKKDKLNCENCKSVYCSRFCFNKDVNHHSFCNPNRNYHHYFQKIDQICEKAQQKYQNLGFVISQKSQKVFSISFFQKKKKKKIFLLYSLRHPQHLVSFPNLLLICKN